MDNSKWYDNLYDESMKNNKPKTNKRHDMINEFVDIIIKKLNDENSSISKKIRNRAAKGKFNVIILSPLFLCTQRGSLWCNAYYNEDITNKIFKEKISDLDVSIIFHESFATAGPSLLIDWSNKSNKLNKK